MRVLLLTSEWPTEAQPHRASFIVQQVKHLRAAGVAVEVFSFEARRSLRNYGKAWWALRRTHRLKQFDLLHAHFGQSALLAWGAPTPLVVNYHGSDLQGIVGPDGRYTAAGRLLRQLSRFNARRAAAVIVVAEHLKQHLPTGVDAAVVPGGIDLSRFRPLPQDEARRTLKQPLETPLILFAADPERAVKRYPLAQQAVALLGEETGAQLVVLRGVPHEQVPVYMSACDVLLLTSRHEGSPTVVKEALACNLPVVSVDVGDVRERLRGVEGCIVCPDDRPETIAEALKTVLARGGRVPGREAVQGLSAAQTAQRVLDVYRGVVEARRQGRTKAR